MKNVFFKDITPVDAQGTVLKVSALAAPQGFHDAADAAGLSDTPCRVSITGDTITAHPDDAIVCDDGTPVVRWSFVSAAKAGNKGF